MDKKEHEGYFIDTVLWKANIPKKQENGTAIVFSEQALKDMVRSDNCNMLTWDEKNKQVIMRYFVPTDIPLQIVPFKM